MADQPARISIHPRDIAPGWQLRCSIILPRPIDEVFPFFADAHNLESLTPSTVKFRVLTPKPIEMRAGAVIDYKLKIKGVPIRWRTEIPEWDPPNAFVDVQVKGPYVLWHHIHTFESVDHGKSTLVHDAVHYIPRGWVLAPVLNTLFIKRDLIRIFAYRSRVLAEKFGEVPEPQPA